MNVTLAADLAADLDASFERLVLDQQDRLYAIALRILGDPRDAEEVAQDAFVRAYRAIATYEAQRIRELQLRPWLTTIVVNLCRNRVRRRAPQLVALERPPGGPDGPAPADHLRAADVQAPDETSLRRESTRRWAGLVASLPDRYRTPIVLRHVDGLSYQEMSSVLGRPEGTLKAQVHRGLALLRDAYERSELLERQEMTA